ncbi:MAG: helix-turn-helix transcriptional regulator [Saprospiraceae bacterium]|nr:helix-turn-helix transcriptional regulator [Saprospiraceae bacterium]
MELVFEKIHVPDKHSFITRNMILNHHSTKIHSHKNFELNLITCGAGKRLVGSHIAPFEEGDLVLMGPDLPHCWDILYCEEGKTPSCIVVHFYENIISSDFFNIPELHCVEELLKESAKGIFFQGEKVARVRQKMEKLCKLTGLPSYITLLEIFCVLLDIEEKEFLSVTPYSESFKKDLDRINLVYQYVLQNIQSGVKQEEAAALLHMAPGSFCRYFRSKTNITFMEYVKKVRIGLASRMLLESDKRISEICYESGYNNIANFNHHFKTTMGKTPSEFRKTLQELEN